MLSVIHHIEDVQVACFAIIFGIMALQARRDRTIRFVFFSYLLATVVSVLDVSLRQPFSPYLLDSIFCILSLRYAILLAGLISFLRLKRWPEILSFSLTGIAITFLLLLRMGVRPATVSALYYFVLAVQTALMWAVTLQSPEKGTRAPRYLLASLFLLSVAFRSSQIWTVLATPSPRTLWWRDESLFINSTVVGCLLPFTIVWMMNARVQSNLLKQSLIDPLTELLNRRGLTDAAQRELARYIRARHGFAVAVVDIDHFKLLNDTYGHACGDEVLRQTASLFRDMLRQSDIVSRSGGEEFVVLLPMTGEMETHSVMERMRTALEHRTIEAGEGVEVRTTVSIGIAHTRGRTDLTWDILQHEADRALYAAKRAGRNRVAIFTHTVELNATATGGERELGSAGPLPTA